MGCGGGKTPPDQVSGAPPGSKNPRSGMDHPGPRFQKPEKVQVEILVGTGKSTISGKGSHDFTHLGDA